MRRTFHKDRVGAFGDRSEMMPPGGRQAAEEVTVDGDYLDYLSDMVLELKSMAERADTPTLAGLLDLAYHEARLQRDQRRED